MASGLGGGGTVGVASRGVGEAGFVGDEAETVDGEVVLKTAVE